ncbi:hypothetical protein SS50377_25946 [Spironucleus salmonicida]|nr:hypothetical protein SS50377_25942 [Spironucleus salmonicida]KAH0571753.1 hypothetical protein SS50377_25946 [Spironucleus salmonicida]|eukprot:EST46749.1 Hypothetical protein SS50377_13207 [Spironucleus salmonicida]
MSAAPQELDLRCQAESKTEAANTTAYNNGRNSAQEVVYAKTAKLILAVSCNRFRRRQYVLLVPNHQSLKFCEWV